MSGLVTGKRLISALALLILFAQPISSFGLGTISTTTNTTDGAVVFPPITSMPAGTAAGVMQLKDVNVTKKHAGSGTGDVPILRNNRYSDLVPCPPIPICPDANGIIAPNAQGVVPAAACPAACRVTRTETGWNSTTNAPNSTITAICPAGYAQMAVYNTQREYVYPVPLPGGVPFPIPVARGAEFAMWLKDPTMDCKLEPQAKLCIDNASDYDHYWNTYIGIGVTVTGGTGGVSYKNVSGNIGWVDPDTNHYSRCYTSNNCTGNRRDWSACYNYKYYYFAAGNFSMEPYDISYWRCTEKPLALSRTTNFLPASLVCGRIKNSW